MKRITVSTLFLILLAAAWTLAPNSGSTTARAQGAGTSGNGKLKFRVLYTSSHLPAEARVEKVLKAAHGGFAIDRRPGKGETYFALPGAGIVQISADLKSTRMVATPAEMKDANMHNATLFVAPDGAPYLAFPGNGAQRVFITTIDGKLVQTLMPPEGMSDLGNPAATNYFLGRGSFIPTDVEYIDGMLYMSTGYSNLDFVLTARVASTNPLRFEWNDLAFGGKGTAPGQFGTGHGITVPLGTKRLDISDRPNAEIDRFTRYGQYLSTVKMPLGSLPCDIAYEGKYSIVGSLDGPDRSKGAPIYIMENDQLVSTVMVKEDLGLPNFLHIHNAVMKSHGGKLYIIAQAWNPGDFAILEQVM